MWAMSDMTLNFLQWHKIVFGWQALSESLVDIDECQYPPGSQSMFISSLTSSKYVLLLWYIEVINVNGNNLQVQ